MISIIVNGKRRNIESPGDTPLLYVLRDELGLTGTKYGCGIGQCGSCTVLIGSRAVRSCVFPVSGVSEPVTSIEGLGNPENPHPIQKAFIEAQAAQCGYCTAGMVMNAVALLGQKPDADDSEIRQAMDGNLCRCGSHMRVLKAISQVIGQNT